MSSAGTGPDAGARGATTGAITIALAGNPNSGKTTVFNALTGLRHKVGNYPGVTVERKTGTFRLDGKGDVEIIDLPGAYSLLSRSPDEEIARRVLLGEQQGVTRPDLVVIVVDASNLERNLYLATQVLDTGVPAVIALNMIDVAGRRGRPVAAERLASELGVPVVPLVASRGTGVDALRRAMAAALDAPARDHRRAWLLAPDVEAGITGVAGVLRGLNGIPPAMCDAEALRLVGPEGTPERILERGGETLATAVDGARRAITGAGLEVATFEAEERYRWIRSVARRVVQPAAERVMRRSRSDRADAVLTHRILGPLIFLALLALIFHAIFAWASHPMDWIDRGVLWLGGVVGSLLPEGALRSLAVDGVLGGVGAVLVFLPQILFLFFFISLLEDTGYMARAAFMMDRVMRQFGFPGKACIPLMSSFACAIPGIMAARTIENRKDRMLTIMVAPLMSCSARLPVYTLIIAAFIPGSSWTRGLVMTGLYLLGIVMAIGVAAVLRRTALRGPVTPLIMELPPYRRPHTRTILLNMWDRGRLFVQNAGTVILAVSVILWFLSSYPRPAAPAPGEGTAVQSAEAIRGSFAGRLGRFIEPAIEPLGFDWKIGIGIISSFAAREVFVSTMGTVYGVGDAGDDPRPLAARLEAATWDSGPKAGLPIYTLPVAVALLVFYVIALQCASTVAVVRRETNSWRWPVFMWCYMTVLAYGAAWIANRVTTLLG